MQAVPVSQRTGHCMHAAAHPPFQLINANTAHKAGRIQLITSLEQQSNIHPGQSTAAAAHTAHASTNSSRRRPRPFSGRLQLPSSSNQPADHKQQKVYHLRHRSRLQPPPAPTAATEPSQQHAVQAHQTADATVAKPIGNGLSLLMASRQLPHGAQGLVGYTVLLARNAKVAVGTVTEVRGPQLSAHAGLLMYAPTHCAAIYLYVLHQPGLDVVPGVNQFWASLVMSCYLAQRQLYKRLSVQLQWTCNPSGHGW